MKMDKAQMMLAALKGRTKAPVHPPVKGKKKKTPVAAHTPAGKPDPGTPVYESGYGEAAAAASKKPSGGMSKTNKSKVAKQARSGKDMGKKNVPGKAGFKAVQNKAAAEYGSQAAGKRVAGAVFWKKFKRGA